jgi:hypothetical protein
MNKQVGHGKPLVKTSVIGTYDMKFLEFILTTFAGRFVLFLMIVAAAWAYKLLG